MSDSTSPADESEPAYGQGFPVQGPTSSAGYATPVNALPPLPPLPPIPVQPLTYGRPVARRPGLITAIGVISIIVASLTTLSVVVQGFQTFAMFMMAQMTTRMATAAANASVAEEELVPYSTEAGIADESERQTIIMGLGRTRTLRPDRQLQLDELLLVGGQEMFLLRGEQLTVQAVASNVSDSGRKYSDDGNGADFYIVGQGEIEVYDDHAVFYPRDGGEMISAAVVLDDTPMAPMELGETAVDPAGEGSAAGESAFVGTNVPTTAPAPATPAPQFNRPALAVLIAERVLSFGLAIYLFVIGIMVLRQSPGGRRLHRIYAVVKIPLAVVGGWATWRLWNTFFAGMGAGAPASSAWTTWIVIITLLACAYPIGLLIALRSRAAREYYDSVRPTAE